VVGGGQAGLATCFYLRRAGLVPGRDFVILDAAERPGGAWPRTWDGLRLFSPAGLSSLPGWMMPPWDDATRGFPPRDHVVDYLTRYEQRYDLRVMRPHRVASVQRDDDAPDGRLLVTSPGLTVAARAVVSATGTWERPFWPAYPGMREFAGRQLHAADYRVPDELAGGRVVVVGGGNSAAQILAEVSTVAETTWVTVRPPRFLPDDVDGRVLFATARARIEALEDGREHAGVAGLGDIVMVAGVKKARDRGVLQARPMFSRLTAGGVAWPDGRTQECDTVIWCTGFRPAPCGTCGHSGCPPRTATSGSAGRRGPPRSTSRGCTSSATATGRARRPPPWPASDRRPGRSPPRSPVGDPRRYLRIAARASRLPANWHSCTTAMITSTAAHVTSGSNWR
jgi:putative flavoprotein involved in K+ transport